MLNWARGCHQQVRMDDEAHARWEEVYAELSEGRPGMLGAVTSRSEAQVVRLALVYALLDQSEVIGVDHLRAALAVWDYCDASARYIFGDALGDPVADTILEALRAAPDGLNRTEISGLFQRHKDEEQISRALTTLAQHGRARRKSEKTRGRPVERWYAT